MGDARSLVVVVEEGEVSFCLAGEVVQSFQLDEVRLIAEYTTARGARPFHWFLKVIITEERTYEISMYQDNIDDILDKMGDALGSKIVPSLGQSKDWQSAIHYPAALLGQPLWHITTLEPAGVWDRIMALIKGKPLEFAPTAVAQKIFSKTSP